MGRARRAIEELTDVADRIDQAMRRKHPNLWRAIVLDIVCLYGSGIGYAFTRTPPTFSRLIDVHAIGITLILAATMLVYGFRYNLRWYGRALALGAGVTGFLTLSVLGAILDGYANDKLAPSIGSFFLFLFVTCQLLIQAAEPLQNPVSEANAEQVADGNS